MFFQVIQQLRTNHVLVMFGLVRLSLNDRLYLFHDVLLHTLVYYWSVNGSRVGSVTDVSLIAEVELILVLCCGSIIDVFSALSRDGRSIVLVAGGLSLFVKDRLYFLVDFRLLPVAVDDRGDLVVRVPIYLFTDDGIFDISSVSSVRSILNISDVPSLSEYVSLPADSVFDIDPAGLSVGESLRPRTSTILVSLVFSQSGVIVAEGAHNFCRRRRCDEVSLDLIPSSLITHQPKQLPRTVYDTHV